jgi:hypothetical protein
MLRPGQLDRAKELYAAKNNTITEIMNLTGFKSRATFYKYVVNDGHTETTAETAQELR